MSKTLSTEMSVDQIRRHIADRNRQMPVERLEIEEAEAVLQAKLLEQTNVRLDQLNMNLEQFRGEMGQLVQALQEGLGAYHGLQRSIRRYSRATSLLTLLLVLATAILVRIGYVQMEGVDHTLLLSKGTARPSAAVVEAPQAQTPSKDPAPAVAVAKPQDSPGPWARSDIVSPYHLPPNSPRALEPWPARAPANPAPSAATPAASATSVASQPIASTAPVPSAPTASVAGAPAAAAAVEKSAVATIGPKVYGPLLPSGLMSPFPPVLNDPTLPVLPGAKSTAPSQQPSASTSTQAGSWRPET